MGDGRARRRRCPTRASWASRAPVLELGEVGPSYHAQLAVLHPVVADQKLLLWRLSRLVAQHRSAAALGCYIDAVAAALCLLRSPQFRGMTRH